ncbi:Uncharacterised protein [Weissella viridescens]|uniref:Uncharacterized protein n=1 Tax=Weissella viridescens TaxID=1629 RepID=A0A380P129_WEIVI|nr:Uncharacterised protein [Weissella viridescens]
MTESDFNQPLDVGQAMRKSMQENHLNARYAEVQKKYLLILIFKPSLLHTPMN